MFLLNIHRIAIHSFALLSSLPGIGNNRNQHLTVPDPPSRPPDNGSATVTACHSVFTAVYLSNASSTCSASSVVSSASSIVSSASSATPSVPVHSSSYFNTSVLLQTFDDSDPFMDRIAPSAKYKVPSPYRGTFVSSMSSIVPNTFADFPTDFGGSRTRRTKVRGTQCTARYAYAGLSTCRGLVELYHHVRCVFRGRGRQLTTYGYSPASMSPCLSVCDCALEYSRGFNVGVGDPACATAAPSL
jgi:hypothetical protein